MERLIDVLRGDGLVDRSTATEALAILIPVIEAVPRDPEANEAARGLIVRLEPSGPLQAVADWWFTVTTGEPSPMGGAYMLPETLGERALDSMKLLLEAGLGSVPPAERLARWRLLESRLSDLSERLTLDHYGTSKLPKERDVWAWLLGELGSAVEALRSSQPAKSVDLDDRGLEHELKAAGIDSGSRRWREVAKRARLAVEFVNECVGLQQLVQPWSEVPSIDMLDDVPVGIADEVAPIGGRLLGPVLRQPGPLEEHADPDAIRRGLSEAAAATDDRGRSLLATIADSWMAETGTSIPVLDDLIARRGAVELRLAQMAGDGQDTTEVEVQLLDHEIEAAEKYLRDMEGTIAARNQEALARRSMERFRSRLEQEGISGDERWSERLQSIEQLIGVGDSEGAKLAVLSAEREVTALNRDEMLSQARQLLAQLESLGPPESVLFDVRTDLDQIEHDEHRVIPAAMIEKLAALVDEFTAMLRTQVSAVIGSVEAALASDASEFASDVVDDFELRLDEVRRDLDRQADLRSTLATARELSSAIDAERVHRWTAGEGEHALLDHIERFCTADLDFSREDIRRLHVAIKTKPFVILAGLTGSGKSSLARLYAEATGATAQNGRFRRVAVRPDWIDQSEVLGYVNPVSGRFEPGWLAETIRSCEAEPDRMFFVLLDEMNLAPVEQYFAEVLSAMEEARSGSADVRLPLYQRGAEPKNRSEWAPDLMYPANLVLLGTVNVDESTRPLSDRVIDRANVMQLNLATSDRHHQASVRSERPWIVPFSEWRGICETIPSPRFHDLLLDVAETLRRCGIGVGVRAHVEIERFVSNGEVALGAESALDWGIVQRIIPKIRGFKSQLAPQLAELQEELSDAGLIRSERIVKAWLDPALSDEEFLDGADHRVGLHQY